MKQKTNLLPILSGIGLMAAGGIVSFLTRSRALAEQAGDLDKMPFALGLIVVLLGLVVLVQSLRPKKQATPRQLALAAMFAALCYIGFTFFKIDIPVGESKTAFHLGNVFCVLGALLLGGRWGGMAGAVGMTIADLTAGYVTSAPKTFLMKLLIGLIVGTVAHKVFHLSQEKPASKVTVQATAAAAAGMAFNVVVDPILGYFYKTYLLGIPQQAAKILAQISALTTLVNAVVAVLAATVFYAALRPALQRAHLFDTVE